ncbi:beta-galactosidase [Rubellicoccus peritrichatus]|uniref:Beta-galactosidase n=1 Tax=Rubellicoccus peritrichatus TaxID=3080537 RepID=A0AAQ3QV91_9BACT|nr:beta-galactosidase [Puniceicoccus sp. CR14]WOO40622.1 beta-galactosidase [Puniceicoccus sp. CR14]
MANAESEWEQLLDSLNDRREVLAHMISDAQELEMATEYAETSALVIDLFIAAAAQDKKNPERVREIFSNLWFYDRFDPKYTTELPERELRACIAVADHAIDELQKQLDHELELRPTPDLGKGTVILKDGNYQIDSVPFFPSTLIWAPRTQIMADVFGRLGASFYSLNDLNPDGTANYHLNSQIQQIKKQQALNTAPISFLTLHELPKWLRENHPDVSQGGRFFVQYDIDNPYVTQAIKRLYEVMIPPLAEACGETPMVHLLANEPHFATIKGGWESNGLSDYTVRHFHDWLKKKYLTVTKLNHYHGENYRGFDEVLFTLKMPVEERQVDPNLRGTAVWYDWIRFNHDRVNQWFTFLKEQCQANDPNQSPVSIKVLGYSLSQATRDGGMDMEYLTKLQDIVGADLRCTPLGAGINGKTELGDIPKTAWQSQFSYDWAEQTMFLDFSKSLCPEKLFYDSEWHGFSSVSWRHCEIERDYVRSALWLAFSHGMGMIDAWLWGRKEDGALNNWADHFCEFSTQPIAADAFARTMKELNAFAPQVLEFSKVDRTFMIYYCEEAAIQDQNYTRGLHDAYEALKLLNWRCGFTTPSEIHKLDPAKQTVVVTPISHINDNSLRQLREFAQAGGKVVLTDAEGSFLKSELAIPRNENLSFAYKSLLHGNYKELMETFENEISHLNTSNDLPVSIIDLNGDPSFGVIVQQIQNYQSGKRYILLNNISKETKTVKIATEKSGFKEITDIITAKPVSSDIELRPKEVLLLECQ